MKTLTHYTSLLNAFRILISKRVKMSNISNANDYLEKNSINVEFRTMMTFCCSKVEFSVPMWLSYSGRKDGAAIKFIFGEDSAFEDLLLSNDQYPLESFSIEYIQNYVEEIGDDISKIGHCKDKSFEYEEEYRYLIDLELEYDYDLFCNINLKCLKNIILVINMSDKEMVETIMKSLDYPDGFLKIEINEYID